MNDQILKEAGLTAEEAGIYLELLKNGLMPASKIALGAGLKRGITYKTLDELTAKGLVIKKDTPGTIALFAPAHPSKLKDLLKSQEEHIKTAESTLNAVMGQLVSSYNLLSGKPNVRFFEGEQGMKEVLADSLTSESEILTYVDIESIQKYIPEINKDYVEKRKKFGIKKRGLVLDTAFTREFLGQYDSETNEITETRFLECAFPPFKTIMQIYNNKISYLTLSEKEMIGVIIEDAHIYTMHKFIFECLWSKSRAASPSN